MNARFQWWERLPVYDKEDGNGGGAGAGGDGAGAGDGGSGAGAGSGAGGAGDGAGASGGAGADAAAGATGGTITSQDGGDGGQGDGGTKGPAWGENWRKDIAGEDAKLLGRLERYASPKAVVEALAAAQDKIRSGAVKAPLPENATPEQIAEWRKDNGIPEKPDGYDINLGDGHVWGEADKPLLDSFLADAHKANIPPGQVKAMLGWYGRLQQQQLAQQQEADAGYKKENIDRLVGEWGSGWRAEVRMSEEWLDSLPDGLGDVLRGARDGNGRLLMAHADFIRFANAARRDQNPLTTVLPAGSQTNAALETEMQQIAAKMADPSSEYYKAPMIEKNGRRDTPMAHRYYELLQARERVTGKAA